MTDELYLIDTSVWLEVLPRGWVNASLQQRVDALLSADLVAITGMIRLELLGGARSEREWERLDRLLEALHSLSVEENHWQRAARMGFQLRPEGLRAPNALHRRIEGKLPHHGGQGVRDQQRPVGPALPGWGHHLGLSRLFHVHRRRGQRPADQPHPQLWQGLAHAGQAHEQRRPHHARHRPAHRAGIGRIPDNQIQEAPWKP